MNLNIQSAANYTTPDGGSASLGPITVAGTITPVETFANLVSGNNSLAVPSGAVGCVITPPTTNAIVLKAKTTSGDTGINIHQSQPSMLRFDPNNLPATLYINAASNTTGNTTVLFF